MRRTLRLGVILSAVLGAALYLLFASYPDEIIRAFNSENNLELYLIAKEGMRIYFSSFLIAGVNITIISYFSAKAKARPSFIISLMRGIMLIPPILFIFASNMGINGVWMTIPIAELITFIIAVSLLVLERNKSRQIS